MVGWFIRGGGKKVADKIIKSVKPNVPITKLDKAKSKLAIQKQKTKASTAKFDQTLFESKNKAFRKDDFTFDKRLERTKTSDEKRYNEAQIKKD